MDILLKEFDELEPDSSPFWPSFCFAKKKKTATSTPIFSQIEPPQITGVDLNLSKLSTSLSWFNLFMICMLAFVYDLKEIDFICHLIKLSLIL
jgi:hypothetical protein